jgi:hypothetical protein
MQNIKFENRAVAFIDVLGFKSVVDVAVKDDEKLCELKELIGVLQRAVPNLDGTVDPCVPRDLIPKHIYISDSIVLSAPLESDKQPSYRGLSTLVMRVIQISHILLSKGYLIRGGISVGQVWHTDSNIVGTAYQEAYQIETRTHVPRVELSQGAKELWNRTEGSANTMCLDYKSHFMVNVLHDYYIQDTSHGAAERAFEKYSRVIKESLEEDHPESIEYKWWWFKQYLESEVARNEFIIHP